MKRLLSVLLATMLLLSCGSLLASAAAQEAQVPVKVSLQLHSEDSYEKGLELFGGIAEEMGIALELITFNDSVGAEKQNTLLASGDLPDLFWTTIENANLYGADGMFLPLDTLTEQMPNFSALMAEYDITPRRASDGNLYLFPKFVELSSTTEGTMTYRKDVLDAMGETEPTTPEGWYTLYKKVQEAYPEMIVLMERSATIESQMQIVFGMGPIASRCGILAQGDPQEIVFLPTSENWKAMLEWYNRLYAEGILYQGYATVDYSVWWDQTICTDKAFACNTQNFNRAYEATTVANDLGMEEVEWWVALNPENPFTNTNEIMLPGSSWVTYGFAVSADTKVADAACKLVDWFYGQECMDLQTQMMEEEGKELPLFFWPIRMLNAYMLSDIPVMADHFSKNTPLVELIPVVTGTVEGAERLTEETENLDTYVKEMRDKFIMGMASFEEWDAYVAECERLGAGVAVEVVQGYLDAYYAAK